MKNHEMILHLCVTYGPVAVRYERTAIVGRRVERSEPSGLAS